MLSKTGSELAVGQTVSYLGREYEITKIDGVVTIKNNSEILQIEPSELIVLS